MSQSWDGFVTYKVDVFLGMLCVNLLVASVVQ
jgi:hypothetical protein